MRQVKSEIQKKTAIHICSVVTFFLAKTIIFFFTNISYSINRIDIIYHSILFFKKQKKIHENRHSASVLNLYKKSNLKRYFEKKTAFK